MKLIYAFALSILAQILAFLQLQGQLAWKFPKENPWIMALMGIPISYLYIQTTRIFNDHFDATWPGRLIGFGVGVVIFTAMSWLIFQETPTPKTLVCVGLGLIIIAIQVIWK